MRGERGDGWQTSNERILALATRIEALCVAEHQGDAVAACLVLIAGVVNKNARNAEDQMAGVGAVVDQLVTTIKTVRGR